MDDKRTEEETFVTEKDRPVEQAERVVCRLCGARYWRENGHRCRFDDWNDWDEGERLYDCVYVEMMDLFIPEKSE